MSSLDTDQAVIKILDELNAVVIGLRQSDYTHFYNEYGIFKKGYFFAPQYKTGRWDGKDHFFTKNGKTSVNLLPLIIPVLKTMGYKIKLIDQRSVADVSVPIIDENYLSYTEDSDGNPIVLGEHQVNGVNAVTENAGGILLAATGAGKSILAAALVKLYNEEKNFRCLVIVPNKDLINQTSADIALFDIEVGRYFGDVKEPNALNVVSTWQSLQNNPKLISSFPVIVVDECLDPSTMILMADDTWKKISEILPGELVKNYSEKDKTFKIDTILEVHKNLNKSKEEKFYRLEFDNGVSIKVTGNHKFLTSNNRWVRADELTDEDEIIGSEHKYIDY